MRLLLQSSAFYPAVGGPATAMRLLALGLREHGHEVLVVTDTPGESLPGLDVVRDASAWRWWRLARWCDLLLESARSPRSVTSLHLFKRAWALLCPDGLELKEPAGGLLSLALPYDDSVFHLEPGAARARDFITVARLEEENGVHLAIEALHHLHLRGYTSTHLTIIGDGSLRPKLEALAGECGVSDSVHFTGPQTSEQIAAALNRHRIALVPALTQETFGFGVLEALACGCLVFASDLNVHQRNLGLGGLIFPVGNPEMIANLCQIHLDRPAAREAFLRAVPAHLAAFTRAALMPVFARHLEEAAARGKGVA